MKIKSVIPKKNAVFLYDYGVVLSGSRALIFGYEADVRWVNILGCSLEDSKLDMGPGSKIIGDE